ncbi:uncharacterized protein LOC135335596 [Halichondria panicea]|uniref:uncharacterized protein LOC135335596 n=1 Tax=Halichondria panicea TaxID=6063 RepID=UPI00312BB0A0
MKYLSTLLSLVCIMQCMFAAMQAACVPARLPEEENMQEKSRSRSSGSAQCSPSSSLSETELTALTTMAQKYLTTLSDRMREAKTAIHMRLSMSNVSLPNGFYLGEEVDNDYQGQIASAVGYLCCSVPYVLDVMKQEAVNEILGVSSYFHAVYDILDPGSDSNLSKTLEKIVIGAQFNSCHVPEPACRPLSAQNHSAAVFAAIVAQDLINLSSDTLLALNTALTE